MVPFSPLARRKKINIRISEYISQPKAILIPPIFLTYYTLQHSAEYTDDDVGPTHVYLFAFGLARILRTICDAHMLPGLLSATCPITRETHRKKKTKKARRPY